MGEGRRYKIEGVLGKGGFGTVYRAQLLGEGGFTRKVALKVLNADMAGMEDVARRLRDEARLLGLLRHRAILHVDGLVRLNNRWTVVMEYIEGADLQKVARAGGVPLGPALEIVGEVAAALHVAYTTPSPSGVPLKLLHRDIKPPNILLTAAGEVKVLDFGIARAEFGNREAKTKSVLYGSVGYMAPERLDFEELPEGDVYALGTVLYEILVGSPFGKASIRTERHAEQVVEGVRLVERKCGPAPPELSELLASMLAYDPEDRPSAREVERRCRTLRQQVQGPFLRDWSEKAVPPLVDTRLDLPRDDFSNSIVSESGGVSLLDAGDASGPIKATMPLGGDAPAPPRPPARTRRRPVKRRKGGGMGAMLTGLGLVGCLGVAGLGLFVFVFMIAVAASIADSPDIDTGYGLVDPYDQGGVTGGGTTTSGGGTTTSGGGNAPAGYGPPAGPHVRAALVSPWSGRNLPIAPGVPAYNDATTLVVMYSGSSPEPLAQQWNDALMREFGYAQEYDFTNDQGRVVTYRRGDKQLTLSVSRAMGTITASMVFTE